MKKIVFFTLATFALLAVASCEKNLDIPQKGVTAYETFVQGTMKLKNAKIRIISTDVEVVLASTTEYTDFQY
jgi:hypothetical protein